MQKVWRIRHGRSHNVVVAWPQTSQFLGVRVMGLNGTQIIYFLPKPQQLILTNFCRARQGRALPCILHKAISHNISKIAGSLPFLYDVRERRSITLMPLTSQLITIIKALFFKGMELNWLSRPRTNYSTARCARNDECVVVWVGVVGVNGKRMMQMTKSPSGAPSRRTAELCRPLLCVQKTYQ